MIPYPATAAPRRIAFTAAWQRAKGIDGLFASNGLHCYFQAAKREDAIFINVDPKGFVELYRLCRENRWGDARAAQERIIDVFGITRCAKPGKGRN